MKKNFRFTTMVIATVMLLALTGCEGTGSATTVTTPVSTVEATPTEAPEVAAPTEAPVVEATPTEEVAAPTEAPTTSSNLQWEVVDFAKDGTITVLGNFHDGETVKATNVDHLEDLHFALKTEKVIKSVELISENDNFGLKSELVSERKIAVPLRSGIAYDNYEAKTIITYEDGTTEQITIYIDIPEGVY